MSHTQKWHIENGYIYRNNDLPAEILANGTQRLYKRNYLHRDGDLPAVIWRNGTKEWWVNGISGKVKEWWRANKN